ncbi:MAG: immune inhibitor A [Chloroflexi bacterium]|nr:immune inhibitor A [Chloroflexota bacterium]
MKTGIFALLFFLLTACGGTAVPQNQPLPVNEQPAAPASSLPPATPTTQPTDQPSIHPSNEARTLAELIANVPPERNPAALAQAYKGLTAVPTPNAPTDTSLGVGTQHSFKVLNIDSITIATIQAELLAVGQHAYLWFELSPDLNPKDADLQRTAAAFDDVYTQVTAIFGQEDNPGIDGDPRIHILSASPLTICDAEPCGILGYFSSSDTVSASVDPQSNEREMFVMNGRYFGEYGFIDTLAHEFRHMIEANYDNNDSDWAVEGSAMLAEDLLGFSQDAISRANLFLRRPDQQLNAWTDGDPSPHYGQGYLLNRYIYNRLGPDLYREFATSPENGLDAVTAVAAAHNLGFDGESLWLDWLAALAIHDQPGAGKVYSLREGIETAAMTAVTVPFTTDTTVNQYAADYYQLPIGDDPITITFAGSAQTPLIPVQPVSGSQMWLANRANYSQAQLTRAFDLRGVDQATLHYAVYYDIERGYDFAYVAASTDGGQSWQGLQAPNMQGSDPFHDPSETAFTDYFYSDSSGDWLKERIDLTSFAGQEILLRFEYVTDPILTYHGLALDDIRIPEIGFSDDAESDQGWQASGFVRATGQIPQTWHVILIQTVAGNLVVEELTLSDGRTLSHTFSPETGAPASTLIIAAAAPMTLNPAHYRLTVK